uniref:rRNA N-glycosidase n=1 Tax=Oryza glumipatula TaxID=40148 RepID=A0A0E0B013_9ORYZ
MASSISGAEHLDCEAQHDSFVDRRSEDDTVYVNCEARRSIRYATFLRLINSRSLVDLVLNLAGDLLVLNTLTFSLDGSPQEVLNNYKRLINEIRLWSYWNGLRVDVSPLYGKKKFVYTTAERGSLYLAVKERTNSAVFVIEGRGLWLKGFWTKNGLYEMLPNAHEDSFIDHPSSLDKAAPGMSTLMKKWSKLSKRTMKHIDLSLEGDPPVFEPLEELSHLDSIEKVLETVRILHLSYSKGVFKHRPIKHPVTWDPVDEGEGDADIVQIPNYSSNNYNESLDQKRRDKKKNRGKEKFKDNTTVSHVRGGQPGGAPVCKDLELLHCWKTCQEVANSSAKECTKPFCSMRQVYSQPNNIQKRNISSMGTSGRGHLLKFAQSIEAPRTTENTKNPVIFPENRLINCDMGMPMDLCNMARGHITNISKYRHMRLKNEVKAKITSLQIDEQFVHHNWASRDLYLVTPTSLKAHSECISMLDRVLRWTNIQFLRYSMAQNKFRKTLQKSQQHLLPPITQSLLRSPDSMIDNFQNCRASRLSPQQQHLGQLLPQRRIVEYEILASKRKGCDFISRTLCRPSESIGMFDRIPSWTDIQFLKYSKSGRVQAAQSSQKQYLGPLLSQRKIVEGQIQASCKRKGLAFIARAVRSVRR